MAITTSPDNIPSPTSGDPYNYVVDMAAMADRIQGIFTLRGLAPNPNLLINSNFMVNQRAAVSGASLTNGTYFLDRWKSVYTGSVVSWADSGGVRTLTLTGAAIGQVIEQESILAGPHTLAWGGGLPGRIYNSGATPPVFAPSPVTATIDGTANVAVEFSGNGETLFNVKLERGSVATPFERRPYGEELAACQRYCLTFIAGTGSQRLGGWGVQSTTTGAETLIITPVTMRTIPTITFLNLWWTDAVGFESIVSAIDARYPTTPAASPNGLPVVVTFAAAGAARYPGTLAAQASGSHLILDADL